MSENGIRKNNKENTNPINSKIIGICVLILIFVMALSAFVAKLSGVSLAQTVASGADGSLIYDILPDSIENINEYSSGLVLLTDTAVDYIDSSGKKISTNSHMYAQPVIDTNGSTVLLYDKGGTNFRIEKNTAIYNTYTVSGTITTAVLGAKDNYLYVLNDDGGYQSHIFVYSYKGQKQFEWGSASDYCATAALSDNGKSAVFSMLTVEDGKYVSKVIFVDFNSSEPVYSVSFNDCTVFRLIFTDNKNVVALTDNGIFTINKNGETEEKASYSASEIRHSYSERKTLNAIAAEAHGNSRESYVKVFSSKFKELYTLDFSSEIYGVRASENYLAVLLGNTVKIYDSRNLQIGNIVIGEKCIDAVFSGRTLYVLTLSGIYSFNADCDFDFSEIKASAEADVATQNDYSEETTSFKKEEEITAVNAEETTIATDAEEKTTAATVSSFG